MGAGSKSRRNSRTSPHHGVGMAIAHHGELLQGVFEDENGRLHRGLVTLPLPCKTARANFQPAASRVITVHARGKTKAVTAARLTLDHLGIAAGGALEIDSDIPVGHGYGSSTADVVATIRAVAAAYSQPLAPPRIARIAVDAEQASDAIAFDDQAVLFAQREGIVLEDFGGALPPMLVVGCKANGGLPIDTLKLSPARYDGQEIQQFRVLRGLVAHAIRHQDPICLGRAATASAWISQRRLPKQHLEQAMAIAQSAGACGIQVAHSGSLVGILFDVADKDVSQRSRRAAATLQTAGFVDVEICPTHRGGAAW
ncbi:kinase [Mesorhizobium sp. CAU 1741]|uniref:GHMP family kinase ATP-binding protein n=1 Tax=Mesorhizobium sp. CAU 1741 TaxID=3140366 RepID=UPI00325C2C58